VRWPERLHQTTGSPQGLLPDAKLRELGQTPSVGTSGTVIAVCGAKGGIGKSTVSANLAVALARLERSSVCVVDLDNGFGDIAGMLDAKPERSLGDLIRDLDTVERHNLSRYVTRHKLSRLDILAGPPVIEWRTINPDAVRRVVELLAKTYGAIVLDTSARPNEISELAVELATVVLMIVTTESVSVRDSLDAMRALNMLSYSDERLRIIMNAISSDDGVGPAVVRDALQREVFWEIPYDKRVRMGTHLGQPIVVMAPESVAARSLTDLAIRIAGGWMNTMG